MISHPASLLHRVSYHWFFFFKHAKFVDGEKVCELVGSLHICYLFVCLFICLFDCWTLLFVVN